MIMELGNYLDGDSHLDAYWVRGLYDRLPLVGADNVVDAASNNRGNTNADTKANQQRLLIASHDAGSGVRARGTARNEPRQRQVRAALNYGIWISSPLQSVYN